MRTNITRRLLVATALCSLPGIATAQTSPATPPAAKPTPTPGSPTTSDGQGLPDIIVTAQKRKESINSVGMSINAASGDALIARGVKDTADLVKVVPGLTYQPSTQATPVYTLRGVGFYDSSLASAPAVSTYIDEVPLPFPIMTKGASLDLERVEVLKGPQGTLFGQNATGGAINYIAAKPTDRFAAGGDVSVTNFGELDARTFVSGPLSDTLRARLAIGSTIGGDWQKSVTRNNDTLGRSRLVQGRLLLDWTPTSKLRVAINLNGFIDRSDTPAFQMFKVDVNSPFNLAPSLTSGDARKADWTAGWPMRSNNRLGQASARIDYDLSDNITLTSISSYAYEHVDIYLDADGTYLRNIDARLSGHISTANEELRLTGKSKAFTWILGGSYEYDSVLDNEGSNTTQNNTFAALGINSGLVANQRQKINTAAVFGNIEFRVTDALTLQAGARYTDARRKAVSCTYDNTAANPTGNFFTFLEGLLNPALPVIPIGPGQCITLDPVTSRPVGPYHNELNEGNVSWRFGATYKIANGPLLYANASRGYKAGAIANISASNTSEYAPVVQERVDAFEAGIKAPLFDRRVQFNLAGFYYNYKDKQVRGTALIPPFGNLEKTINVPKSRIYGVEADLTAAPVDGLTFSIAATYIDAKVNGALNTFNAAGIFADYNGARLPYTPKFQLVSDAQYEWGLSSKTRMFIGGGVTYRSNDNSTFATATARAALYALPSYTLLDLRAGFAAADKSWRLTAFGRNVTNDYYWTNVHRGTDALYRAAGRPATYGLTLTLRTN